jgi:hypothetical protein
MAPRFPSVTALALLLGALLAGCQNENATSLLFVQVAEGGRLLGDVDGDGWQHLVLDGVSPHVIYFSDRPQRLAGTTSLDRLMTEWDSGRDSFAKMPPNAALAKAGSDAIEIVEIRRPVRSGTTLTYETRILETSTAFTKRETMKSLAPGDIGRVVLFIDDLNFYRRDPMNRPDNFGRWDGG